MEAGDLDDGRVGDRTPGHLIGRDAAQVRLEHPHGAAVGDHEHVAGRLVLVVPVRAGGELVDELSRPCVQVADGLAVGRPGVGVGHPAVGQAGHGRAVRSHRGPLAHSERPLPQPDVGVDRQPEHRRERGRGLLRPAQVAGVDRPDRTVAELPRRLRRLVEAAVGQLGQVVVPLREAGDVPGRLAVPDQPQGRLGGRIGEGGLLVHARQLGQSVLKNDENVNDFSQL